MVRRGAAQCRRPSSQRRPGGRLQSIGGCFACSSRSSRSTISALAASTRRRILPCCRPVAKVHRLVFESVAPTSALPSDLPGIGKSNCALPAAHDLLCELSVAVVRLYQHRPKISACPTPRVFTETRTDGKSKTISRTSAAGRPAGHAHRPASRKDGVFSTRARRQMNMRGARALPGALRARRPQPSMRRHGSVKARCRHQQSRGRASQHCTRFVLARQAQQMQLTRSEKDGATVAGTAPAHCHQVGFQRRN